MDIFSQFSIYIFTLFLAALLPGPGMIGLMYKTLAAGHKAALIMLLGLMTADMLYLAISVFLVASINQLSPYFLTGLIIFSSFYLLYLALQFWKFKGDLFVQKQQFRRKKVLFAYRDGLLITLSNPKTISFYLALVPAIFGSTELGSNMALLFLLTLLTLTMVGAIYIFGSLAVKQVLKPVKIQKLMLRSLSVIMATLSLSLLYKEFSQVFIA